MYDGLPFRDERFFRRSLGIVGKEQMGFWEVIPFFSKMFPLQTHWQKAEPLIRIGDNVSGHRNRNFRVFNLAFHSFVRK